jgi:hypothetical protein
VRFEVPFRTKSAEFHQRVLEHIRKAMGTAGNTGKM